MCVQHSALQPHRRTIGEGHGAGPQVFMAHILVNNRRDASTGETGEAGDSCGQGYVQTPRILHIIVY